MDEKERVVKLILYLSFNAGSAWCGWWERYRWRHRICWATCESHTSSSWASHLYFYWESLPPSISLSLSPLAPQTHRVLQGNLDSQADLLLMERREYKEERSVRNVIP